VHLLPRSLTLSLTANSMLDPKPASPWPVDENYWLGHCEGFQVDGPGGRVGIVEHVVYGSRVDRPDVVAVSWGCGGCALPRCRSLTSSRCSRRRSGW
jgi:hypothetical protein